MGFTPLSSNEAQPKIGFTPIQSNEDSQPDHSYDGAIKTMKAIGAVYPILETAANLASQAAAMPIAGLSGLGAMATNAIGLTHSDPADVVSNTSKAMTYQPRTELGQHLTGATMYPFEKLAEVGGYAGGKTLDATHSPLAATIVDTSINALPMVVGGKASPKESLVNAVEKPVESNHVLTQSENLTKPVVETVTEPNHVQLDSKEVSHSANGFIPTQEFAAELNQHKSDIAISNLANARTVDEAIQFANESLTDHPLAIKRNEFSAQYARANKEFGDQYARVEETTDNPNITPISEQPIAIMNNDEISNPSIESLNKQNVEEVPNNQDNTTINTQSTDTDIPLRNENINTSEYMPDDAQISAIEQLSPKTEASVLPEEINQPDIANVSGEQILDQHLPEVQAKPVSDESNLGFTPINAAEVNLIKPNISDIMPNEEVNQIQNSFAPGTNYVSIGIDNPSTAGKLAENPIRREDVLIPFIKELNTSVYEGRVKGKNRLGFYIPKIEAVRIKNKSDLEVAAHEIAHLIDDRVPEIKKAYLNNKEFRNELRGVSYDASKLYEGYAEFMRLYMTQPELARAKAPEFSKWFDEFTNHHEYGSAIKKAQEGMTSWFNQDALHRAQSKIGLQEPLNGALDGLFDRFRQATADDLHGVYRMERQLTGKTSPLGAYETARSTRGSGAMIDGAISIGAPVRKVDGSFTFEGKGLQQILDPVAGNLEEFLMYAVGRSSHELMLQNREKLFTKSEIDAMLKLENPEFREAFNEYQKWNRSVLDFAEAHGVINHEVRQLFNRSQYLPFYRAGQAGAQKSAGGVTGNWNGIKKLTGGDENLRPILGNMTQNAAMLIEAALKNEARTRIVDLAKQKGGGKFMVKIDADSRPVKIDKAQVKDELLKAAGIDPMAARSGMLDAEQAKVVEAIDLATEQGNGFFEFLLNNQAPQGNVMAVLRNGKPEYYEVADPLLLRAITSLNRPAQNWLVSLLGWPKRIGQAAITLTPDFMIANIARDTLMATVMSKAGFKPFVDSVNGMRSRIIKDQAYKDFIANGGGFASHLRNEETFKAHLERFYTSKGIDYKTVLDTPDKIMYGLETIADAFEISSRLGEYKRMVEQGEHPRHAAYVAREISTDFAMRGDSKELGFLYDTVMFLRPAVLSIDRLARGLTHDENKGAIAAKAGTIALMSVGLYMINKDNPEYQDMDDWDRDGNWHFFVPKADGTTTHLRYPKIWEIGALSSIAERTMAATLDQEPELGKSVGHIMGNLFSLNFMPQIIAPLYEQATNKNSFTGSPIETMGMENVQPFLRAKPNTSETMKALGMATSNLPEDKQIPPARAEALLRGYFNTWAMYGLMLSDNAFFDKNMPERRLDEMPVLRRFYEASPAKHTKYETMFYDMLGEAQRLHGTIKTLDEMGSKSMADEFDKNPKASTTQQLQRVNENLQAINRDMNDVRNSDNTKADKRKRLDELTLERNELLKATVNDVRSGGVNE